MRPKASSVSVLIIHPRMRRSSFLHLMYSSEIFFASLVEVSSVVVLLHGWFLFFACEKSKHILAFYKGE